jgi:hypothetical protein
MKIDMEWLEKEEACSKGKKWFKNQKLTDGKAVIKSLVKQGHMDWANWTIVRLMTHPQKIRYAIFAAEQVIELFEKEYPNGKRPRNAVEAAKKYLKESTDENKHAAKAAGKAASYAAAYAAYAASNAAAYAAYVAVLKKMKIKILKFGLTILD